MKIIISFIFVLALLLSCSSSKVEADKTWVLYFSTYSDTVTANHLVTTSDLRKDYIYSVVFYDEEDNIVGFYKSVKSIKCIKK
jgi:hypothetical protein